MHFTKMHGLGNDYLYYFGELKNPEKWAVRLSDRHFGIGSDGIITISPSNKADFKMRIFNADGSEALMCGNGIRCVGKYLFDKGYTDKTVLSVETLSGNKELVMKTSCGKVAQVTVSMGKCEVKTPVTLDTSYGKVTLTPVSVGNLHAVIFVDSAEDAPLTTVGKELEHNPYFPDGVNVEFAEVKNPEYIRMRVWERGSAVTLACGTGACAAAAAAVKAGLALKNSDITVELDGGKLNIKISDDDTALMTGTATTVCECEVEDI